MSLRHTIKQGEHLLGIAASYGFGGYDVIWDHPENAELKQLRETPAILLPGDVVFIPDARQKAVSGKTRQTLRFRVSRPKALLRLKLLDLFGLPLPTTKCVLEVEGARHELETDGDGVIESEVPVTAEAAKLSVRDIEYELRIGHLDPVEEVSGQQARLNNLGYYAGEVGTLSDDELSSAIEQFQGENGLEVDGTANVETLEKLKKVYGC